MIVICSNCAITCASSQPFAHEMYSSLVGLSYKLDATSPSTCAFSLFALSIARSFVLPIHILVVRWFVPPYRSVHIKKERLRPLAAAIDEEAA